MTTRALPWGPSRQGLALLAVAAVPVTGALLAREPYLLSLGVPALWSLLTTARTAEPPSVTVLPGASAIGSVEEQPVALGLSLTLPTEVLHVEAAAALPPSFEGRLEGGGYAAQALSVEAEVVPHRWGRKVLGPLRVQVLSTGGLRSATVDVPLSHEVYVLPQPARMATASAPLVLPNRLGEHVTRAAGHGVEPMSVRAFAPGDALRRVNWRVSSRRQQLHVTVSAAERVVELVVVVDALSDVGTAPGTSLDVAVRLAAGLAERWLAERDRVGLLVIGAGLRWLLPTHGRSQLQKVAAAVLWASRPPGQVSPDLRNLPRQVVPPGAVVVFLSPLLEEQSLEALAALRERSRRVIVVDVLGDSVPATDKGDPTSQLAARLWKLDREATVERLRRLGNPVLTPEDGQLDRLIALALRVTR